MHVHNKGLLHRLNNSYFWLGLNFYQGMGKQKPSQKVPKTGLIKVPPKSKTLSEGKTSVIR